MNKRFRLVVLGVLQGKRSRALQNAVQGFPDIELEICDYRQALDSPAWLCERLANADFIKIDSPGEDAQVQHRLSLLGWELSTKTRQIPKELRFGELAPSADWYAGFTFFLWQIAQQTQGSQAFWLNSIESILMMTDKLICQQHFVQHAVPVPKLLGPLCNDEQLPALLDAHGLDQVFIKARYGSSASGVIAYRRNRRGQQHAASTLMLTEDGAFNVKKIKHYKNDKEIARLINQVALHEAYVETWIPKPAINTDAGRQHFDLRVVALGGQAQHRIARASAQAMTNLHLDSQRIALNELTPLCDEPVLEHTVMQAAKILNNANCIGFDVICRQTRNYILEANAFGDLLPGLNWMESGDTYQSQLTYLLKQARSFHA